VGAFLPLGKVLAAGISGTFAPLVVAPEGKQLATLIIFNSLNQPLEMSFDNTTVHFELHPGEGGAIDLTTNRTGVGGSLSVRHAGVAPTSGSLRVSASVE